MFRNKRPLVYLLAAIVGMSLVIQQQSLGVFSAFASESSARESGYDHGCDDAGISDPGDRYINQPDKGPSSHTGEFMAGYNDGFNMCGGSKGGGDFDESEPDDTDSGVSQPDQPQHGTTYWWGICTNPIVDALIKEPCSTLVTPDGYALTPEGKAALERITCGGQTLLEVFLTKNPTLGLQGLRCL